MSYEMEPMLDLFIFETEQMLNKLENLTMSSEESGTFDSESIQEIFRAMHTIKGSAAMMMFDQISTLAHILEDLFDLMRNNKVIVDTKTVADFIFLSVDYIQKALERIQSGSTQEFSSTNLKEEIGIYIEEITGIENLVVEELVVAKQYFIPSLTEDVATYEYEIVIGFTSDSSMENIRGYTLMNAVKAFAIKITSVPDNLLEDDEANIVTIKKDGFKLYLKSNEEKQVIEDYLTGYPYVGSFVVNDIGSNSENSGLVILLDEDEEASMSLNEHIDEEAPIDEEAYTDEGEVSKEIKELERVKDTTKQISKKTELMISVNVDKLDRLMDLVGELVVSESMVSRHEKVMILQDDSLEKAIRQHRKIINDVQDVAMSIRMVPLSGVFQKMKRLVRDVSSKMGKDIEIKLLGEQTEVDKNIIDKLSDPLMHLIRNSCDHGIEDIMTRKEKGKSGKGTIILEAKNSGGDVLIIVQDDGKGIDSTIVYNKAIEKGMIRKDDPKPMENELLNYIFRAGFSTKEEVSEYSGRGVGMDVAVKNIEKLGGNISVLSEVGKGAKFVIKIPLTLSIINGMKIRVGKQTLIIPITAIYKSFKVEENQYVLDPQGNEMILLRGNAYELIRLHKAFQIKGGQENIKDGIVIMIGNDNDAKAVFADELLGEYQVVVKPLPTYLNKVEGVSGCAILGDGGISLILDLEGLLRL